jgi:hypothetical protein
MFTNEVNQIARIWHEERLNDAAIQRKQNRHKVHSTQQTSLVERMGDWFIAIGLKLKAQQGSPRMSTPVAQR